MLGGPFFTTVPSGRVGRARDSAYFSNEAFVHGVRRSERDDQVIQAKGNSYACYRRRGLWQLCFVAAAAVGVVLRDCGGGNALLGAWDRIALRQ